MKKVENYCDFCGIKVSKLMEIYGIHPDFNKLFGDACDECREEIYTFFDRLKKRKHQ
jgi:hypothetical protein